MEKSENKSAYTRGFSLIEVLIVVGLAAVVSASGYVLGIGSYQRYTLNTERDLVVSILQRARSQALSNIAQQPHGIKILDDSYVLFVGDSYSEGSNSNVFIPANTYINREGIDEIVFAQLSGEALLSGTIVFKGQRGDVDVMEVSVYQNGRIDW